MKGDLPEPAVPVRGIVDWDPVPWVRERDLDLMLAESLSTRLDLAQWLVERVWAAEEAPRLTACSAIVNFNRPDAGPDASGETDVLAEFTTSDGALGLLSIEDKILASPAPRQASRHRAYVAGVDHSFAAAVLVAPQLWIEGHPDEASGYDRSISIEAVAAWHHDHTDPALRWRARVFDQAARQRTSPAPALDLDAWCDSFDAAIRPHGLKLAPQRRMRSTAPGQARSGRHMWCAEDTLDDFAELVAVLYFKHSSANYPGRTSVDITVAPSDPLNDLLVEKAEARGFRTRRTPTTLIVELRPDEAVSFNMAETVSQQTEAVDALAVAASRLRDWWNNLSQANSVA